MELILKYFNSLSQTQIEQFQQLNDLYRFWNEQINVISRKDIENLYEKHVLHSLAIAKILSFKPKTQILDVGTGGGFPGIPLAILFPEAKFMLIDSTGKKIKVVNAVAEGLKLTNVEAKQIRSNELRATFDFVVSRAVTTLPEFVENVKHTLHRKQKNGLPNGIIYLKGGDISAEIEPFAKKVKVYSISDFFKEEFFETKKVIYLPV